MSVSVADRIGFFPVTEWVAGHPFWITLLVCLVITPGAMIIIAPILETRWLPLSPKRQFLAFFPGDLLLGVGVASLLTAAQDLPAERRWYAAPIVHIMVIGIAAGAAYLLTFVVELKGGVYPRRAIFSPTKLYHNGVLYIGYGYVAATTFIADVAGLGWSELFRGGWMSLALICLATWLVLVVFEGMIFGKAGMAMKARFAHVPDWRPFWSRRPSLA